jgi:hypothetical protein
MIIQVMRPNDGMEITYICSTVFGHIERKESSLDISCYHIVFGSHVKCHTVFCVMRGPYQFILQTYLF